MSAATCHGKYTVVVDITPETRHGTDKGEDGQSQVVGRGCRGDQFSGSAGGRQGGNCELEPKGEQEHQCREDNSILSCRHGGHDRHWRIIASVLFW